MPAAALPEDEDRRLASLRNLQALDSEPCTALDAITRAASLVCGVPIALISLVDSERQWFKTNIGLPGVTGTPRDVAFCAHAILQDGLLEVPDATRDDRFATNPLVQGAPHIRAYLGAPLILKDGTKAGTLCMIDQQPRQFTDHQRAVLANLAVAASRILEKLRSSKMLEETTARLRDSEEFLANTGALAGVGGWSLDLLTGKLTWTAETHRIHGVAPDYEPDLERAIAFYAPEAQPIIRAAVESSLRTREDWDLELPFIKADGTPIWVRAMGRTAKQDGKPVKLTGAFQDITARRRKMQRLHEAEERLLLATEAGQVGIWDLNIETGMRSWSPLVFKHFGMQPGRAPASLEEWSARVHHDDRARVVRAMKEALAGGPPFDTVFRVIGEDGVLRHLHATAGVRFDGAGRPIRKSGTVIDVTATTLLTARLRDSQELLARTGELAAVGGWSTDLATRQVTCTAQLMKMAGIDPAAEISEDHALSFYTPEARAAIRDAAIRAIKTGEPWDLEVPGNWQAGQPKWVRSIGQAVFENGLPVRLTGAIQDISDQIASAQALREAQQRANLAMDSGKIGIWDLNFATGTGHWSPLMFELYGLPPMPAPPPITDWPSILHPDDRDHTMRALRNAYAGIPPENLEFRVVWQDGSVHHLRVSATVSFDDAGRPASLTGATWDVTESRQLAEKLANQHELLRVTLESIGDGVITTDAAGRAAWMNPVAERMTGWTASEAKGRPLEDVFNIVNEDTRLPAPNPVEICLQEGRLVGLANHTILISRNGEEYGIEDSASPIRARSGETLGVVLVFHDVTTQRQLAGEMTHRATHDALTGLLNRTEFEVRLQYNLHTAQTDKKQSVMLFIDLDQFKLVNDTCGHGAGDQLLRQVARLLSELVRGSDSVARLGGDEFAILLDRCTTEQGLPLAQKICDRMEDFRFTHEGRRFSVGASIGLVQVDDRWPETVGIMQAADACCYAAKEAGRNRVHQWSESDKAMNARHGQAKWASRLAQALDEDRFVLFAQRIKALQTTAGARPPGIHAEVLLRKVARDGSLILPGAFLPAAERFHIVSRIDRWVLDHAIAWMNEVPALECLDTLAVNLSGQSVGDAAFQSWAIGRLAQAGPRICERLCLEITETAVVTSLVDAAHFNEQARDIGVRVALDDFGAGASSFGYLKSLPVDFLKIDGQFVRHLLSDPLDQAAVRSFTDIAGIAGLRTIAEFVDSDAVMEKLRGMGVDYAQGYLVHKPAPIDELLQCQEPAKQKEAALF